VIVAKAINPLYNLAMKNITPFKINSRSAFGRLHSTPLLTILSVLVILSINCRLDAFQSQPPQVANTESFLLQDINTESTIFSLAFNIDGKIIAAGSTDSTLLLLDTTTGKEIKRMRPANPSRVFTKEGPQPDTIQSIEFSPDGNTIAAGYESDNILLWDIKTGKEILQLSGWTGGIFTLDFSSDGRMLVSGSRHGRLSLWNVKEGKKIRQLHEYKFSVDATAFGPDNKTLAEASAEGTFTLWDVSEKKEKLQIKTPDYAIICLCFSPDGTIIAAGSNDRDATVRLLDVKTGETIKQFKTNNDLVNLVGFSPDGKTITAVSRDEGIYIWDIKSGEETTRYKADSYWICAPAVSPDGKTIAAVLNDKSYAIHPALQEKKPINSYSS
jgi:WD40 repeat protein